MSPLEGDKNVFQNYEGNRSHFGQPGEYYVPEEELKEFNLGKKQPVLLLREKSICPKSQRGTTRKYMLSSINSYIL